MAPGTDTIIQKAAEQRNLLALFAALPLLREIGEAHLREIAAEIEWFSLPGGATLFAAGQAADGLYVVINGALAAYAAVPAGGSELIGSIYPGETVGEMELISGKQRTTTVVAVRDTELARLPGATFERLVVRSPDSMRHVAKVLVQRLESLQLPRAPSPATPRTFAVVPQDDSAGAHEFAAWLVKCLAQAGRTELVLSDRANEQTTHWFHRIERANQFVVYLADSRPTNWTNLCVRQAQATVIVAGRGSRVQHCAALENGRDPAAPLKKAELVLLHGDAQSSHMTRRWLDLYPHYRHHLVGSIEDAARAARLLTGRSVGIVLSGGGARGFAHIGVMRALRDARIAVDSIGGTSIGAIIAAGWAAGWDCEEMQKRIRRSFVDTNPLNDYTLPVVSLVAGRKVGRLLRREFGDLDIEDLRLPFYCVSANLTSGQVAVHRRGPVWFWLRASIAIPGVLPPVFTGRQVHVDGATINNLPVDVMHERLRGFVIAVDVGADRSFETDVDMTEMSAWWNLPQWLRSQRSKINIMQILWRAGMINSTATTLGQRELTDLLLKPPLERIDMLDWQSFDKAIDLGYRYTVRALEKQRDRLAAVTQLTVV